jgi:hypothetical protein
MVLAFDPSTAMGKNKHIFSVLGEEGSTHVLLAFLRHNEGTEQVTSRNSLLQATTD